MRFIKLLTNPPIVQKDKLTELKSSFVRIGKKHHLKLLIIFGSLARDAMRPLSDVDVAFMGNKKTGLDEYLELLGDLQKIFGREDVDITDLFDANPLLRMCVLKDGIFVYRRSLSDITEFKYQTISAFLATQYLRKQFSYYIEKAVLGGA